MIYSSINFINSMEVLRIMGNIALAIKNDFCKIVNFFLEFSVCVIFLFISRQKAPDKKEIS